MSTYLYAPGKSAKHIKGRTGKALCSQSRSQSGAVTSWLLTGTEFVEQFGAAAYDQERSKPICIRCRNLSARGVIA